MATCAQCGKKESWRRKLRVHRGDPNDSLAFCDNSCFNAYRARIAREAKAQKEAEQEAARQAEAARREEERRAEKARQRELEEKKRPFIEAIAASPKDPVGYLELADLLLFEELGFTDLSLASWQLYTFRDSYKSLFEESADHYLKAIALGIRDPYDSGRAKLAYGILLYLIIALRGSESNLVVLEPPSKSRHYCREAAKDIRKHLRTHSEDLDAFLDALRMQELAVFLGPGSDKSKEERLAAIAARIKEVEVRRELGTSSELRVLPPGEPEPPYPENWSRLAEQVKRRDGYRCSECGASGVELHAHHIVFLSSGGSNDLDNLTTLCSDCHGTIHPRMGDARV